ncbi:MAG TPA: hypothetical protein VI621_01565 [Flavobacterium sp.]|nr:hypothetical protein [Flavobacterium sp.]
MADKKDTAAIGAKKHKKMYELVFWNYIDGIYLNHQEVYEAIEEQQEVEGLEELPTTVILNRINSVFSKWERVDEYSWKNNSGPGAFCVKTTPQSIKIDCYGTEGKTMDRLVDILEEYNCPLYDPQVPERFDEMNK